MTYIEFLSWSTYVVICVIIYLIIIFILGSFGLFLMFLGKKNKNLTNYSSWVFQPIRFILSLMTTIFFIPILEIFLNVYSCVNKSGIQVNSIFEETVCWETNHLVLSIINGIFLFLFLLISFINMTLYFESSITSSTCISKYFILIL